MGFNRLRTAVELARDFRRYGFTAEWIEAEAAAGRMPCVMVGQKRLYDPEAVEQVLLSRISLRAVPAPLAIRSGRSG
jgi:hypothetical protein